MKIEVSYSSIQTYVGNHLAVIGKRAKDSQGKTMWSNVMASSQESAVLKDYTDSACDKVVSALTAIVDNAYFTTDNTQVVVYIVNSRWYDAKVATDDPSGGINDVIENLVTRFIQSYTIAEFLNMFAPEYAKKYENEEISILSDLKVLALKKKPGEQSDHDYSEIMEQVIINTGVIGEGVVSPLITVVTKGTSVTLTASASSGYTFSKWSDGSTDNPLTFTASADATYIAMFIED